MPKQENPIHFIDLQSQRLKIQTKIDAAFKQVMDHGQYILGPEVTLLEQMLCEYTGAKHAITCASGTDALKLILMAKDLKINDVVFLPSFTFAATAEVVASLGAIPYFVDVCPKTYNIDTHSLLRAIEEAQSKGLILKGIIAVDLFGFPADYPSLRNIAQEHQLWLLADCAQSFGGRLDEKQVGNLCDMSATSFFPSKPLGGYGDGGCIFTNDETIDNITRSLRAHGTGEHRYDHVRVGINSRLDTFQAAILIEKLGIFDEELEKRQQIAQQYNQAFSGLLQTPPQQDQLTHAFGLYTVRCDSLKQRHDLHQHLLSKDIPCTIYYEHPLHMQTAYHQFPCVDQSLKVTESLSQEVLSLPMHPYLSDKQISTIISTVKQII